MTDTNPPPAAGLVMGIAVWVLPPPWFIPAEAPACGAVLEVPAWANEGTPLRYVCDRIAGHEHRTPDQLPAGDPEPGKHRQVTDNDTGAVLHWDVGATIPPHPPAEAPLP